MSKCKTCGEEIGSKKICPMCGTEAVQEVVAPTPKPADNDNILVAIQKAKTELIEKCAKSVTKIFVTGKEVMSTGTGWHGYDNLIVTNAHVVTLEGDVIQKVECEFSDKSNVAVKKIPMKIVYLSQEEDIAILKPLMGRVPSEVPVLKIIDKPTKQGEMVFTIGNPLHYKFTYTEGAVANPNYVNKSRKCKFASLQTTLTLNSGNSGGPVFNTDGDVVGMATYSETRIDTETIIDPLAANVGANPFREETHIKEIMGYGFCVKSEAILWAIDSIKSKI